MKQTGKALFVLILSIASGCEHGAAVDLADIQPSDVDKIECTGTTGGKDDEYSYALSESEKGDFIELLNQVKLGRIVDESRALSSGAASCYTLWFHNGEEMTVSPGKYFNVDQCYYECSNYDEVEDAFIRFNSVH